MYSTKEKTAQVVVRLSPELKNALGELAVKMGYGKRGTSKMVRHLCLMGLAQVGLAPRGEKFPYESWYGSRADEQIRGRLGRQHYTAAGQAELEAWTQQVGPVVKMLQGMLQDPADLVGYPQDQQDQQEIQAAIDLLQATRPWDPTAKNGNGAA